MTDQDDVFRLAGALNDLAKLYQFRSLEEPLYGTLSVSQSYSLRVLYFQGAKKMSELAADLRVTLSTMTGVVDQLERRGLVERVVHPDDRRSWRVSLTPRGRNLYRAAHEAFLLYLRPIFESRTARERAKIFSFLTEVTHAIRRWQENPNRKARRHGKKNS